LLIAKVYDIIYIVKRLGAPLTQAFGALKDQIIDLPGFSPIKTQLKIK
jgi:hypothetical protein